MLNKKINYWQLAVLFALSRLFSETMSFPLRETRYSMQRFSVIIVSYAILFALYIPLMIIGKKYEGESAFSLIAGRSKALGWIVGTLISAALTLSALSAALRMNFYSVSTVFGEASSALLTILLLAVCGYGCWKGIQGAARSGVVFGGIFIAFLVLITCGVCGKMDLGWLYPALIDDPDGFLGQVIRQVCGNTEILAFAVLAEHVREKPQRTVYAYIPIVVILLEFMHLLETAVLGPYLNSVNFPFFTVSAMSDIVLFQRLDGIDVAVWVLLCAVKVMIALLSVRTIFTRLVGEKGGLIFAGASLIAVAVPAIVFADSKEFAAGTAKIAAGASVVVCGTAAGIVGLICGRKGKGQLRDIDK